MRAGSSLFWWCIELLSISSDNLMELNGENSTVWTHLREQGSKTVERKNPSWTYIFKLCKKEQGAINTNSVTLGPENKNK